MENTAQSKVFRFYASLKAHDNFSKNCLVLHSNPYLSAYVKLELRDETFGWATKALEGPLILEDHNGQDMVSRNRREETSH